MILRLRELLRHDFTNQFVSDLAVQLALFGQDPRNRIGWACGISVGRAIQIHHDRQLDGSLASKDNDI